MKIKIWIPMVLCLFLGFILGSHFGSPLGLYLDSLRGTVTRSLERDGSVIEPKIKVPELEPFQSILGKVVFVNKNIYGGDLQYGCSLKGKVRNITGKPYKDIYVLWMMYDSVGNLYPLYMGLSYRPSIFSCKIDYLDSKAESDFTIDLDFNYSGMGTVSAQTIRQAIRESREEAGIFTMKEPRK